MYRMNVGLMSRGGIFGKRAILVLIIAHARHIGSSAIASNGRKISVVSALLPTSGGLDERKQRSHGARLRIEAFGGCYAWESSDPKLISIEAPEPPRAEALECMERKAFECMDRSAMLRQEIIGGRDDAISSQAGASCQPVAIIRSIAPEVEGTRKVLIYARDLDDPTVELRCEVYITRIAQVAVETTIRSINVDDIDTLSAHAYDEQGNVFSSLEGLEFQWRIGDQTILRSPPLVDTAFQLSPARRALAQDGVQSDMLLVRGVATGQTKVAVELLRRGSEVLRSPDIDLTVKENILLVPSLLRVPPMAHVQLHLKILRGPNQRVDQLPEVPLPVPHFQWSWGAIEGGSSVLHPPSQSGRVNAQTCGKAYVTVSDQRISNSNTSSEIYVTEPYKLRVTAALLGQGVDVEWEDIQRLSMDTQLHLRALPWAASSWYFVKGRAYLLRLEVLDNAEHVLYVPPNFRAALSCEGKQEGDQTCPLYVSRQTPHSVMVIVEARTVGNGTLSYRNLSINGEVPENESRSWPSLSIQQQFHVVESLQLSSPFAGPMLLPPEHAFQLDVRGGSGSYIFKLGGSSRRDICKVSHTGWIQAFSTLGDAEVIVFDEMNIANNISIKVLVRQPGGVLLRPPYQQLQLPSENVAKSSGSESFPSHVRVPLFAQPEAIAGDVDPSWHRLRFWNCSALQAALSAESSSGAAQVVSTGLPANSSEEATGVCYVITVVPKAPGNFTLSASLVASRLQGKDVRLETFAKLQVYSPLLLQYRRNGESLHLSEERIAPCSSATLVLEDGPSPMLVPGHVSQHVSAALEGTHLRLREAGPRLYEILCLRPTPARVQIFAEVRQEPASGDHGSPLVARASAWVTCAVPVTTHVVPMMAADGVLHARPRRNSTVFGLRQGRPHRFGVRFADAEGMPVVTSSVYKSNWVLDDANAKQWLSKDIDQLAIVTVPSGSKILGVSVKLAVSSSVPEKRACTSTYGIADRHAQAVHEGLVGMAAPSSDVLHLRVTADFAVRWPGYPSRHFGFAPDCAFTFEAGHGSGVAQLSLNDTVVSEVRSGALCHADSGADSGSCLKVVPASSSMEGATTWLLQPSKPGYVQVIVEDTNQLGVVPAAIDVSFLPVSRIRLALSEVDAQLGTQTSTLLIVRGRRHPLTVEMWDTAGQLLSSANWKPLRLHVDANDPRLTVEWMPDEGAFSVIGKALGVFEIQADARNHPNSVVYSNTLRVHVFEMFGIAPTRAVVLPGQTFEFTLHGGPAAGASESARVEFVSSKGHVAEVRQNAIAGSDGLVVGLAAGSTTISAHLIETETGRELSRNSAEVVVALPDAVTIELMETGSNRASGPMLMRGAQDPLRVVASLSSRGIAFTKSLLTAPMGSVEQRTSIGHGCRFDWSSNDPSISFVPVGFPDRVGAVVVDVFAAIVVERVAVSDLKLTVVVSCPNARALEAHLRLPVAPPLQLIAPSADACSVGGAALLGIPPLARVPLVFSQAPENLQIGLLASGAGRGPVAGLADHGQSLELVAGPEEGETLAVVRDQRAGSSVPPLMVTIVVRAAHGLHLSPPLPRRLLLHGSAEMQVQLRDYMGGPLAPSSDTAIVHSVSHPSVLASQLTQSLTDGVLLRLRAIREGCAAVNISTETQVHEGRELGLESTAILADVLLVCVVPGAVVGRHHRLLVQPGATVHFAADVAAVQAEAIEDGTVTFSIRLLIEPNSSQPVQHIRKQLATDLSALLLLPAKVFDTRWVLTDQELPWSSAVLYANIRINASGQPTSIGLPELADKLWFHPGLADAGPMLRHLDLGHGVRAPLWQTPSPRRSCSCARKMHSPCFGDHALSSSAAGVLSVAASGDGDAVALQTGEAVARICSGAVSAEADIVVTNVGEIRTEVMTAGPFLSGNAAAGADSSGSGVRVTNRLGMSPLVVLLRFLTREGVEFISGPFHSQNIEFTCQPSDASLHDFFSFDTWDAFNASNAGVLQPHNASTSASLKMPWGPGAAQAACILHPKSPDPRRWSTSAAPLSLNLQISTICHTCSAVDSQLPAWTSVDWSFVPQFIAFNAEGRELGIGESCGELSLSSPTAKFWIWTGGHPVEATLQDGWTDVLAIHISETGGDSSTAPTLTATVVWDGAVAFGRKDVIELQLESRATNQVLRLTLAIDGSSSLQEQAQVATLPTAARRSFERPILFTVLLLILVIGYVGCCRRSSNEVGAYSSMMENFANTFRARRSPPSSRACTAPLHGNSFAGGSWGGCSHSPDAVGPTPFRRVDFPHY